MDKKNVIVIAGPTASGKTALSIALAQKLDGEIVCADSMQIYKELNIATAKPTPEEKSAVPHHLFGTVSIREPYSVKRYIEDADRVIRDITARGKAAILCGGTGQYIDALLSGREFMEDSGGNTLLRRSLHDRYAREGGRKLLDELSVFDPETAARLHENDEKRIIRAIEIYRTTGQTITQQNNFNRFQPPRFPSVRIGLVYPDRDLLRDRIDRRVDQMIRDGLIEETRALYEKGDLRATASQAIGYKELLPYIRGESTLEECTTEIKLRTRQYAKRQMTWFRRDGSIRWIEIRSESDLLKAPEAAMQIIRQAECEQQEGKA